jgi:Transglutaminase-like superfamily
VAVSAVAPLGARDRLGLAGEIALAYVQARRRLRREPIAMAVLKLRAGSRRTTDPTPMPAIERAARLGRAVVRMLSLLPGDTRCLVRSLVLTRLLARRGIPARLVIGARTTPAFLAHAWVECDGVAVLDPGDGSFARLVEL